MLVDIDIIMKVFMKNPHTKCLKKKGRMTITQGAYASLM